MWKFGSRLQITVIGSLLLTISNASAATSTQIEDASPGADAASGTIPPIISVDPGEIVFDYSNNGTIDFSVTTPNQPTDAESLIELSSNQVKRTVIEESPTMSIEATRTGEFVVPIPALGIGWTLLIGASMYRVGMKVLRVRT